MTEEGNTGLIWEYRLGLWLPRPLLFGAFLFAAFLIAAYLSFQWFFDLHVERVAIGMGLMIAWLLTVPRYLVHSALDGQQNGLEVPRSDRHETEVRAFHMPRDKIRRSRLAGAAGVVAFAGMIEVILVVNGDPLVGSWIRLHDGSATMALLVLLGWFFGRGSYFSLMSTSQLPRPQRSDIDLLNLEDLYAMGRNGLRTALVWLITIAIGGFLYLSGGAGLWSILPLFAIALGIGLVVLLRPAREVRSLIRAVKREELAQLEPLLRQARDDTLKGDESTQGRLTDLLAYQSRVESTPEWPFDTSTLLRFGLYLMIPIGSMVGGALVERVVDMVLD